MHLCLLGWIILILSAPATKGVQVYAAPEVLRQNYSGGPNLCPTFAYLRIQKTGSTTLGQEIMPKLAKKYGQRHISHDHLEFNGANKAAHGCVVTTLRDPVERFLSEFTMARWAAREDSTALYSDQWDWYMKDFPFLMTVQLKHSIEDAFFDFLHSPSNPARNRQALYLLGFKRVACRLTCCGICESGPPGRKYGGYPAHMYNWDRDHDELLARAKNHLMSLRAYSITDCYADSMKAIGLALGWDPEVSKQMAISVHDRRQNKTKIFGNMTTFFNTAALEHDNRPLQVYGGTSWLHNINRNIEAQIREKNRVDDELLKFAKQQLWERHGIKC